MSKDTTQPTIFVVDDDEAMRSSIQWLMASVNLPTETFATVGEFLRAYDPKREGCLLLDVRLHDMSGLELLEQLNTNGIKLPVIVITGHGDVPMAVRALKLGACDFIQKPFNSQALLDQIHAILKLEAEKRQHRLMMDVRHAQYKTLTPREEEILELVANGDSSKVVGKKLGISPKTVDIHRANIMKKLDMHTIAELVQSWLMLKTHQA